MWRFAPVRRVVPVDEDWMLVMTIEVAKKLVKSETMRPINVATILDIGKHVTSHGYNNDFPLTVAVLYPSLAAQKRFRTRLTGGAHMRSRFQTAA
ncbi:unnamed protein product [Ectocarpus sp. 12 AP-2014]